MKERFKATELIHIWKCEPCESGDTLSGGESVASLKRLGLIRKTDAGYITTRLGKHIIQRMFEYLDKCNIELLTNISFSPPPDYKV